MTNYTIVSSPLTRTERNQQKRQMQGRSNPDADAQTPTTPTDSTTTDTVADEEEEEFEEEEEEEETQAEKDVVVSDYVLNGQTLGSIMRGTFKIEVSQMVRNPETGKKEKKVRYANKKEPFEYKLVNSYPNLLIHLGAKLSEDKINFLGTALKETVKDADGKEVETEDSKATGQALVILQRNMNAKFRGDAKASAYSSLANKHRVLEGAERDTATAKSIRQIIALSNGALSAESVIVVLKQQKVIPENYTLEQYVNTKLRKG